jgi:hypothetical protein
MAKFGLVGKKDLKGSPARDAFKHWHHNELPGGFCGCDLDFVLVEERPPGIAAILDYKTPGDKISPSEVLAYNDLLGKGFLFFIVRSEWKGKNAFKSFIIQRYVKGNFRGWSEPPEVELEMIAENISASDFEKWEKELRHQHKLKDDKFREAEEHQAEIREWSERFPNHFDR